VSENALPKLIYDVIRDVRARRPERPALIGVAGAQGSGKTHVCTLLEAANRPRFAHFSLDDVYLTRAEREELARDVHPLLLTRGPSGTHDLELAKRTIEALAAATPTTRSLLPRFDKQGDDRAPEDTWPIFMGRPEAILIDGWRIGALPLLDARYEPPINRLEAERDPAGRWRALTLAACADEYSAFDAAFDAIVYLKAPSFEIVRAWRGEQEEKALGRPLTAEENAALDLFVMHYERVTRAMLDGHHRAGWIAHLDEQRNVTQIEERR